MNRIEKSDEKVEAAEKNHHPGTRGFDNYPRMERLPNKLLPQYGDNTEILSGHAEADD